MVAMRRQLPNEHPIHALLEPHVEGTAFINWGAQEASAEKSSMSYSNHMSHTTSHLRRHLSHLDPEI